MQKLSCLYLFDYKTSCEHALIYSLLQCVADSEGIHTSMLKKMKDEHCTATETGC